MTRLHALADGGATNATPVLLLESAEVGSGRLLERLAPDFDVRLVHAPRRANPRRYGRPLDHGHWLVGPWDEPDPDALFATLRSLESLLLEEPTRPCLVGWGDGASLALALVDCWGDRLAAVVAVGGGLPALPAEVARPGLAALPILRVTSRDGGAPTQTAAREARWGELARRGARITHWERPPSIDSLAAWLGQAASSSASRIRR